MESIRPIIDGPDPWQPSQRRSRHVWSPGPQPVINGATAFLTAQARPDAVAEATCEERLLVPSSLSNELEREIGRRVHMDTAEEFELTFSERDEVIVVEVSGDVDIATSPWLRQHLLRLLGDQPEGLILGLEQVTFMDAAGLGTLAVVNRRAHLVDTQFRIAGPRRPVRKVLAITGMDKAISVYPTLADALAGKLWSV